MASRYNKKVTIPQPVRRISNSPYDLTYTFKEGDTLDKLSDEYYRDVLGSWIIMCANPEYYNEYEIKTGDVIRLPLPLARVYAEWGLKQDNE